jgi:hypothetical protein
MSKHLETLSFPYDAEYLPAEHCKQVLADVAEKVSLKQATLS